MRDTDKTIGAFYHKRLIEEAEEQGDKLIVFPQFIKKNIDEANRVFESLLDFDWLIFTDVFAVDFFVELFEGNSFDLFELDNLRICAFGEAVADRLRFVQIHSDIIASSFDDDEIFQQIKDYIFQEDEFSALNFLMVKAKDREFQITILLKEASSNVSEIEVYQIEIKESITKLKTLTKGGAFDEIIFFSPDEVFDVAYIFNRENLPEVFTETMIIAKNEITFQTLRECGFKPKLAK